MLLNLPSENNSLAIITLLAYSPILNISINVRLFFFPVYFMNPCAEGDDKRASS
jgi:hypothetical protein